MSFTPNIPQSGQSLGQTRDAIRNNFTNYNTLISVNHVAPNNSGQGKHTFCEFVQQAMSPATTTGEIAEYCRNLSGTPELYLQQQNQLAGAADTLMSRLDFGVLAANGGYSFLPGGIILQWNRSIASSTGNPVIFPKAFTGTCFAVVVSGYNVPTHIISTDVPTTTGFNAFCDTGAGRTFFYVAIGN